MRIFTMLVLVPLTVLCMETRQKDFSELEHCLMHHSQKVKERQFPTLAQMCYNVLTKHPPAKQDVQLVRSRLVQQAKIKFQRDNDLWHFGLAILKFNFPIDQCLRDKLAQEVEQVSNIDVTG